MKVGGGAGGVLGGWRRSRGESWEDGGGAGESPGRLQEEQGSILGGWRRSRERIQDRMFTQDSSHTDPQEKLATDKK